MNTKEILQGIKDWAAPKVIYDISAAHNNTKYTDLSDALGTNGGNIPQEYRKGGITVRYVRSSDNKYVQARCMAHNFTTDTTQWAIAEEGVYVENPEFVYVKTDAEGKILLAIKVDGDIYYGAGCPQQVKNYIEEKISSLSLDEYEDIVAFLGELIEGDKTLAQLLAKKVDAATVNEALGTKVDKVAGKSLIDENYASGVNVVEDPEYLEVTIDSENKILEGIKADGTKVVGLPLELQGERHEAIDNTEFIQVLLDEDRRIIGGIDVKGIFHFPAGIAGITEHWGDILATINSSKELLSLSNNREKYFTPTLAFKPLCELKKAYICFTDDDGTTPAVSYTLPMVQQKDIPFTFCIASDSVIIQDVALRTTFLDAINATGSKISVAQHGLSLWTDFSEEQLYQFFVNEKNFFSELGIDVDGAAIPGHRTSHLIEAMAGGLLNVVRASYITYGGQGSEDIHHSLYEEYPPVSANRSNLYCLPSCNIRTYTLNQWKNIIDYAVEHKKLINIYMHDFDFVERYPEDPSKPAIHTATPEEVAERKALLEGVIDYAKSVDIEFISLGQTSRII